ncbi:hypothetical protein JY97_15995 [Alkalispirochaeta odontotermitis]|nr:hypothetical protein JY97_15995 [Alkalispirochaeta odontotermitis]CAB1084265.1 hypothetical protein D1AOALGA4SA_11791 [Olavius algarvensis Delta 1 endosymbiont]
MIRLRIAEFGLRIDGARGTEQRAKGMEQRAWSKGHGAKGMEPGTDPKTVLLKLKMENRDSDS